MHKISIHPSELILRGILCNFLVCLAVWTGTRMKSESGKILVIAGIITTFVICGFEHCIANMSTFTIGYLLLDGVSLINDIIFGRSTSPITSTIIKIGPKINADR